MLFNFKNSVRVCPINANQKSEKKENAAKFQRKIDELQNTIIILQERIITLETKCYKFLS
jgi:hypothetical protein